MLFELVLLFAVQLLVAPVVIGIVLSCLIALDRLVEVVIGALRTQIAYVTGERGVLEVERCWPSSTSQRSPSSAPSSAA